MFTTHHLTLPNGAFNDIAVRQWAKRLEAYPHCLRPSEALAAARNAALCERERIADEQRWNEFYEQQAKAREAQAKHRAAQCTVSQLRFDRDRIFGSSLPTVQRRELVEEIDAAIQIKSGRAA